MDQLICTLKLSVSINVNILELPTQTLTKDIFKKGKPSIKQTAEGFHLHLFNKVVGNFPPNASTALSTIVKEKLGIFTAMVGLDAHKTNHGMAIVNITALAANAFPIIYRISAHLKDEFENIVLVPPNIASTPGVHAVIQRSKKRHNLSSNNNSVLAKKVKTSNKAEETVENKTNITFSKSVNISKNVSITVRSPNQKVSQETSNVLNVVSKESSMSLTLNMSFNESIINTPSSSATSTQSFSFPLVSKTTTPFSTITTSSTQKPTSISKHFVESHNQCKATKRSGAASVSRGNNVAVINNKPIVNAPKTGLLSSVDDLLKTVQKVSSGPTQSSSSENIQSINTVVSVIKQEKADSMLQNSSSEKNLNNLVNTTYVSKVGDVSSIHTSNQLCSMNNFSVLNSYTPSRLSNLPENIIEKIGSFREDHREMGRLQNSENNLLFEGASTGETCNFLLGRTPILQQGVDQEIISDASSSDQAAANNNVSSGIEVVDISCDNNEPELVLMKTPLDDLFDLMSELPQDQEQEPCAAIQQAMLPHQKIALHWMIERENTDELPPFWECVDEGRDYFNTATLERKYWEKPECVHGGILADDMGLGKTLTAIALILTNHIEGKPMFRKVSNNKALPLTADEIDETIPGSKMLSIKKKKDGYLKASKTTRSDMMKPGFRFRQMYKENLTKSKKSKKSMKVKKEVKQPSDNLFSDDSDDNSKDLSAKHVEHIIRSMENLLSIYPLSNPHGFW